MEEQNAEAGSGFEANRNKKFSTEKAGLRAICPPSYCQKHKQEDAGLGGRDLGSEILSPK
jgi:hypothetical protein